MKSFTPNQNLAFSGIGLLSLLGVSSCTLYMDPPDYSLVANPGDAPCAALEGTSSPVYLCKEVTQGIVFVHPDGDDNQEGSREEPVQSLKKALLLTRDQADKKAILIAGSPSFSGPLELDHPVDILGGFDSSFAPDKNALPSISSGESPVIKVAGVPESLRLSHVTVSLDTVDTVALGMSVYDTALFVLHDVTLTVPSGVSGQDGAEGGVGQDGARGGSAGAGTAVRGGPGGLNGSCPEANGGTGGTGADMSMVATPGEMSAAGVSGGAIGEDGDAGSVGEDGQDGMIASSWSVVMGVWTAGEAATQGDAGNSGQGGGGGGGGTDNGTQGGGGGAGGAGGCGGEGGMPGTSGMPSLGIIVDQSTLLLSGSTSITVGDGGDAGIGGAGGAGGKGAAGLPGSGGGPGGQIGGRGGAGADGGTGGAGGAGLAGESIGIFCQDGSASLEGDATITTGSGGSNVDGMPGTSVKKIGCE